MLGLVDENAVQFLSDFALILLYEPADGAHMAGAGVVFGVQSDGLLLGPLHIARHVQLSLGVVGVLEGQENVGGDLVPGLSVGFEGGLHYVGGVPD